MTIRARLVSLFPGLMVALSVGSITLFILFPSLKTATLLMFVLYGLPVACFRLHNWVCPIREELTPLDEPHYVPWWGAHQLQLIYDAVPALERMLRLAPGLYSAWLRLWGSRVGRDVYWTPRVEIVDRSMLRIGDRVVFGHKVACYPHVVDRRNGRLLLYLKRIEIGNDVFLGAGSRLGPGAHILDGVTLPLLSDIGIRQTVDVEPSQEGDSDVDKLADLPRSSAAEGPVRP